MAAQEIAERNPGGPNMVIEADVTQAQDMERAVSRTIEEFGELSVGVNNAGIAQWFDAMEMSEEDLRRMFDVVFGVFYGAVAQARQMATTGYGKIINTASISGYIANRQQSQLITMQRNQRCLASHAPSPSSGSITAFGSIRYHLGTPERRLWTTFSGHLRARRPYPAG